VRSCPARAMEAASGRAWDSWWMRTSGFWPSNAFVMCGAVGRFRMAPSCISVGSEASLCLRAAPGALSLRWHRATGTACCMHDREAVREARLLVDNGHGPPLCTDSG